MGYDITLVTLSSVKRWLDKNNKTISDIPSYCQDFKESEETYLSYNFSKFSDIWYARTSFGKTSEEFANDLRKASAFLTEKRVIPEIPKGLFEIVEFNGNIKKQPFDGWSTDIRVFHWHIKRLLKICEDNPKCLVLADISHSIHITEEDLYEDEEDDGENETPTFITYYRHPVKGNMKVDTFEKASEIAIISKRNNDPRWKAWEELAWKLPGAPSISSGDSRI